MKNLYILLGVVVIAIAGFFVMKSFSQNGDQVVPTESTEANKPVETTESTEPSQTAPTEFVGDYKNATYQIDGKAIKLNNGISIIEAAPGSEAKIATRYFGNLLSTDLNGDGQMDVVFILAQETGGSGVFYYAVGAVVTENGYVGTDGYLLGDRIAPQSTDESPNPRQKNVVVFNYADRAPGEPMTAQPSVGKSVYLKLVPETMRWAIVEPDFEGESNL